MYIPAYFKIEDFAEVRDFISEHSFGILVSTREGKIEATHTPFILDESNPPKLLAHISRANPQWRSFAENDEVMVIFHGPHAYISSSWYDHENVPTWNYEAVHIYGRISILKADELWQTMKNMVDHYEKASENPVSLEKIDEEYVQKNLKGIVGFAISIDEVQGVKKLSQNHSGVNQKSVIEALEKRHDENSKTVAQHMRRAGKH